MVVRGRVREKCVSRKSFPGGPARRKNSLVWGCHGASMPTQSHFVKYKWVGYSWPVAGFWSGSLRTTGDAGMRPRRTPHARAKEQPSRRRAPTCNPSSTQVPELSLPNWPLSGDPSWRGDRNCIDLDLELWPGERLNTNQSTCRQSSVAEVLPEHCVNHSDLFLFKADDVNGELRHVRQ